MEVAEEGSCGSWKLRPYSSICRSVIAVVSLQVGGVNMGGGLYSHSVGRGFGGVTVRERCFVFSHFIIVWWRIDFERGSSRSPQRVHVCWWYVCRIREGGSHWSPTPLTKRGYCELGSNFPTSWRLRSSVCHIVGTSWRGCSHVFERLQRCVWGGISLCKRSTACAAAHCARFAVARSVRRDCAACTR